MESSLWSPNDVSSRLCEEESIFWRKRVVLAFRVLVSCFLGSRDCRREKNVGEVETIEAKEAFLLILARLCGGDVVVLSVVLSGVKCTWLCLVCFSLSSCEIRFGDHDLFLGCAVPPAKPLSCTAEGDNCTGDDWGDQLKDELSDALADDPKWGSTQSLAGRFSGRWEADSAASAAPTDPTLVT